MSRAKTRLCVAILACSAVAVFGFLPASAVIDSRRFARPADSVLVVDRFGTPLRYVKVDGVDRRWVSLGEVSPHFIHAVMASEDSRFAEHGGVDYRAVARAAITNLLPWRGRSGASTISEQVVKLVYGRPGGLPSKALELVRARALEKTFSKDEILEQYVNRIPFGDRIEGVERASEEYFGCSARDLDVGQAALLAGIPRAPSVTEPRRHFERALARRNYVLRRMRENGFIDVATEARVRAEKPQISARAAHPNEAARFVDTALGEWHRGALDIRGVTLETSLDLELEHRAAELCNAAVAKFEARGVENAAAVVIANASGEVLAYVAAARVGDAPGGALDLLLRRRQPGSTLKPFVYEALFERGATAATILDDTARPMSGAGGRAFDAHDYDGRERGPVRARVALSASLNLAALDASARVGEGAILERLSALGVRGIAADRRYGAALVLGGLDVRPLDLARAYVALARGGTSLPLAFAPRGPEAGVRVMKPDAAEVTSHILSDPDARRAGFGADLSGLFAAKRFALKTGTSSGWRDAWAVAFDRELTVVVWLGDPSGRPLGSVSGFEAAAPVAVQLLAAAHERASKDGVTTPATATPALVSAEICAWSGLRAGPRCRHPVREWFAVGTLPTATCSSHDERGDFVLEPRYADWARRARPSGVAETFRNDGPDSLVIVEPEASARVLLDPSRPMLHLRARRAGLDESAVRWELDGARLTSSSWQLVPGHHEVVAVLGNQKSAASGFDVELP